MLLLRLRGVFLQDLEADEISPAQICAQGSYGAEIMRRPTPCIGA